MELLNLQSSLQSEIQAKAAISEELSRTRADLVAAQKYDILFWSGGGTKCINNFQFLFFIFWKYRDLRETRQRFDSVGGDLKRKDSQIRDLQQRLENSEGCKSNFHNNNTLKPLLSPILLLNRDKRFIFYYIIKCIIFLLFNVW